MWSFILFTYSFNVQCSIDIHICLFIFFSKKAFNSIYLKKNREKQKENMNKNVNGQSYDDNNHNGDLLYSE